MIKRVPRWGSCLSGSTVHFMLLLPEWFHSAFHVVAMVKLFVGIGKKIFFRFFFETADRYTTGPLLDSEKYFRKKIIFSKSKNN